MSTFLNPDAVKDGSLSKSKLDAALKTEIENKQDALIAGIGIDITDNKISCTLDTTIFKVVDSLPTAPARGDENKIHLVLSSSSEEGNTYDEYIWVNNSWERTGSFRPSVDLSRYAEKSYVDSQIDGEATARTNADAELQTQINGKQEALTLTVKDNGNIVLANIQGQSKEFMPATPSGDPMHYAYVAAGAKYNENTGFWKIGTLDDLTNDELKYMYNIRLPYISANDDGVYSWKTSRTIFLFNTYGEGIPFKNISMMFYSSNFLEIPMAVNNTIIKFSGQCVSLFAKCKNLKYIRMKLKFDSLIANQNMFYSCSSLEEVIISTNSSLYFNDCSKLSTDSVLYMINNEFATSPITITLYADVYNKCMANADILAALEQHTNISLASA